jgi:hypothetical protein
VGSPVAIASLSVLALVLMVWFQVRQVRRVGRGRRAAVSAVEQLLGDAVVTQDGIAYPTVAGDYRGERVKVELVVDTLTLRRLPRLWLVVTVRRGLALASPVDIVVGPLSSDIVSPGAAFKYEHERPAAWPEHLRIASRGPVALAALHDVEALAALLHDELTKSVVVAPGGVRVVRELARGDVASYRVVRRPNFNFDLAAADVAALLDAAIAVADGVAEAVGAGGARIAEPVA